MLILDDVFAELDAGRRDRLAALVADAEQVLVTAAVPEDIPSLLTGAHFRVSAGTLTESGAAGADATAAEAPMRPDPERARLAAEALARARADAWARGERPGTPQRQQNQAQDPEREGLTPTGTPSPSWSARPRRDDPQPLTAAVGGLLSARGWRERAAVGAVFGHWPDIVGPQLALHTKPESFDSGELTVSADSPAWATQVRLMAPQLLKRLAEELGHGTVRHIRVNGPSGPPRRGGRLRVRYSPPDRAALRSVGVAVVAGPPKSPLTPLSLFRKKSEPAPAFQYVDRFSADHETSHSRPSRQCQGVSRRATREPRAEKLAFGD